MYAARPPVGNSSVVVVWHRKGEQTRGGFHIICKRARAPTAIPQLTHLLHAALQAWPECQHIWGCGAQLSPQQSGARSVGMALWVVVGSCIGRQLVVVITL